MRNYCPDCGSLLPDEPHAEWCFCKPYERRAADLLEENRNLSESVKTLRDFLAQLTEQRNTAWTELRVIRGVISADDEEATSDEVYRVVAQYETHIAQLKAEAQQSEKIRAELEAQLAGAARVLITVEQERDEVLKELDKLKQSIAAAFSGTGWTYTS